LLQPKTFHSPGAILIVADNDDTPDDSFANVCGQIEEYFGSGTAPKKPLQPTRTRPPVTVFMVPAEGADGHLELLCSFAADGADKKIAAHVDTFMSLIGADNWTSVSRVGKAWLRVDLAARCENDPFVPLGVVFTEKKHESLIPLTNTNFDDIANVIANLGKND
jgi:hypothetical protein